MGIEYQKMKDFKLHWLTGDVETVRGYDIADAMNRAGYGGGAVRALDYWAEANEGSNSNVTQ